MTQEKFNNRIAVYPGSFDPITNGHVDIIKRGIRLFDKIIVLVAYNPAKTSLFTVEERVAMIKETFKDVEGVQVDSYSGLLVDYLREVGANVILRGMRALS
ncbi:MAG: pantetheine-phosphate adenylyltransferase, partial [Smithellaceae bacterium]